MKIEQENDVFMSGGIDNVQNFSIELNAKAFDILSKKLYSDGITALIRELTCNAVDAHIAAGTVDKEIEITFPSLFEDSFVLRDYGTGLSHDDVVKLYTTYFKSTKTNSNEFTGGLGIGSKSVFAYSDNFNLESFFNGTKYSYFLYKNNGFPCVSLVSEEPTTEHNGLKITIAVQREDVYRFKEKGQNILKWFGNVPIKTNIDIKKLTPTLEETEYALYSSYNTQSGVLMGNIFYPHKMSVVSIHDSIVLKIAIGEVDITASREALEYTDKTKKAIESRIEKLTEQIVVKLNKEIAKEDNYFKACLKYYHYKSIEGINYNGKKLTTIFKTTLKIPLVEHSFSFTLVKYKSKTVQWEHSIELNVLNRSKLVLNDDPKNFSKKVKYADFQGQSLSYTAFVNINVEEFAADEFKEIFGIELSSLEKISDWEMPPKQAMIRKFKVKDFTYRTSNYIDYKDTLKGIYIELNNQDYNYADYNLARSFGLRVYGVAKSNIPKLKGTKLISIEEFKKKTLRKLSNNKLITTIIKNYEFIDKVDLCKLEAVANNKKLNNKFLNEVKKLVQANEKLSEQIKYFKNDVVLSKDSFSLPIDNNEIECYIITSDLQYLQ
jgi:hypothetical protein